MDVGFGHYPATAIWIYLGDVNQQEPAILSRYEKAIPEVKRALTGETPRHR